jgi:hypothetical protein
VLKCGLVMPGRACQQAPWRVRSGPPGFRGRGVRGQDREQQRGSEGDRRADRQEGGSNRAPTSSATAEIGPGPVASGPVNGLLSWNTTTAAIATSAAWRMATLIDALSERIPLKNGKTPTMSEVTITASSTPSGSRLSAALWR